jgi:phenylacetate-CoA ligase
MGMLFRNVIYPVYHWAKNDGVNQARRQLEESQWFSAERVAELQRNKLQRLIKFAGRNVPYYRNTFRDLGISASFDLKVDEFQEIPILTKQIIRERLDDLVSEDLCGNGLINNSTSGSTGETLRYYTDFLSVPYRKAAGIRSHSWSGWRLGDRSVSLWGAQLDEKKATTIRGWLHRRLTSQRFLSSFDLSVEKMDEYVRTIQAFKPVEIFAYPGPMERFADHCIQRGVKFPSVRSIVTSAETLWPHQREVIEQAFGVKIFNQYGCREVSQIATECEHHDGLHISAERVLLEVVDEAGAPCPPGTTGKFLITDLDNYGMPMIRYDIGDRGALSAVPTCECGRGLPRLKTVEGRTLDVVQAQDGRQIGGTFWTLLLRSKKAFKQFQVIQEEQDKVTIRYVPDATTEEGAFEYFVEKIKQHCGTGFGVEFEATSSIDITASGKQRLIISRLS